MTELSKEFLDHVEEQVEEQEAIILIHLMIESDDDNIHTLLEEPLMVTKLVHSEELELRTQEYRQSLIDAECGKIAEEDMMKIKLDIEMETMKKKFEYFEKMNQIHEAQVNSARELKKTFEKPIEGEATCDSSEEVAAKNWLQTFRNILTSR